MPFDFQHVWKRCGCPVAWQYFNECNRSQSCLNSFSIITSSQFLFNAILTVQVLCFQWKWWSSFVQVKNFHLIFHQQLSNWFRVIRCVRVTLLSSEPIHHHPTKVDEHRSFRIYAILTSYDITNVQFTNTLRVLQLPKLQQLHDVIKAVWSTFDFSIKFRDLRNVQCYVQNEYHIEAGITNEVLQIYRKSAP